MKHENNFFLYAIGSAFLLVSAMTLISSASLERREALVANIISVSAFVPEHKTIQTNGFFSGRVFQDNNENGFFEQDIDKPLFDREVFLWKENEEGKEVFMKTSQTDVEGTYSFEVRTSGNYFIKIDQGEDESIVSPPPLLDGFSYSTHAKTAQVAPGEHYYAGMDFAVVK